VPDRPIQDPIDGSIPAMGGGLDGMPIEPTVLVLDGSGAPRAALAQRLRRMGYRALRAKTPEEAFALVEEARHCVTAALIPPDLAVRDLGAALESLSSRSPSGHISYVVVGAAPGEEVMAELRAAGLKLALWDPIDDARLRFQVNRALAGYESEMLRRSEMRAPLELPAQVIQAGRSKEARVYTLSSGGVYLDTPRPAMRNTAIDVEIDFWPSPIRVSGVVAYTSVPGNLRRPNLPIGMGVKFQDVPDSSLTRMRRAVAEVSLSLMV
jgi:CheY-like chemotaxis protein